MIIAVLKITICILISLAIFNIIASILWNMLTKATEERKMWEREYYNEK